MTPAEKISAAQAKREEARHIELEALVRPFAVHLKEELWKREGQWRVQEKQRALLREIPADDLAAAVIRSIIGLLWRRKYDKDTGQWDVHREEEVQTVGRAVGRNVRSEEHTSELQSLAYLVCRLLLEKKKSNAHPTTITVLRTCNSRS